MYSLQDRHTWCTVRTMVHAGTNRAMVTDLLLLSSRFGSTGKKYASIQKIVFVSFFLKYSAIIPGVQRKVSGRNPWSGRMLELRVAFGFIGVRGRSRRVVDSQLQCPISMLLMKCCAENRSILEEEVVCILND